MSPTPAQVGLPSKFVSFRRQQWPAIEDGLEADTRFVGQMAEPGQGKTVQAIAQALLRGGRAAYLTGTRSLESQLMNDFESIGLVDIRGKANYDCSCTIGRTCDDGNIGGCPYAGATLCNYQGARTAALSSRLVTTNYSYWISNNCTGVGLGKFDFLICDEAHSAADYLANALQIVISKEEIFELLKFGWPEKETEATMPEWQLWAEKALILARTEQAKLADKMAGKTRPLMTQINKAKKLALLRRKLDDLSNCRPERWVCDCLREGPDLPATAFQFDPINVSDYAERYLFKGIPHVLLTSGTLRPRTFTGLGIMEPDYTFFEYPSSSTATNSPLIYVPTVKIDRNTTPHQYRKLVARVDELIKAWGQQFKGIIHTHSYELRNILMAASGYSNIMVTHYAPETVEQSVERFRGMRPPAVLVSPAVTTGLDFPGDEARWQLILRVPWPNDASRIEMERRRYDKVRSAYRAMQTVLQARGRAKRSDDDWQRVFIFDRHWETFWKRFRHLAPASFGPCVKRMDYIPQPE